MIYLSAAHVAARQLNCLLHFIDHIYPVTNSEGSNTRAHQKAKDHHNIAPPKTEANRPVPSARKVAHNPLHKELTHIIQIHYYMSVSVCRITKKSRKTQ